MQTKQLAALALADTMLASSADLASLLAACQRVFDAALPWAPALCAAVLERTGEHFHYFSRHELAAILREALAGLPGEPKQLPPVRCYCVDQPIRPPAPAWLSGLALPALPDLAALSTWLGERVADIDWFADQWRLAGAAASPLQHYHYRWLPKRSGGMRLLEVPKARLRRIQQRILRHLLDRVPPHEAAHGFTQGRSCLTHAALHTGKQVVLRLDLKDFFPSIAHARVHALFEKLGYSTRVAGALARICVNRTPRGALAPGLAWVARRQLQSPHLPQGSPCSPALANLCAFRLDLRLSALAASMGATYSRYADDLAFSGDATLVRAASRFSLRVAAIALEEGFMVNHRKTRVMGQGARQQLTGVVVNRHANLARPDYERLKAVLHNCVRHGPGGQNRDRHADFRAYLAGRIAWVSALNPQRALKLQAKFDTIAWE